MSREIKFRIWDDRNKVMVTKENCDEVAQKYTHDVYYEDEWYPVREIDTLFEHLDDLMGYDDIHVMQYTGLSDRNGKEIFEGDVVRYGVADFEVFAGRGGFGLQEMNSALSMKHGDMWITALMATFDTIEKCEALEVIGNVFEQKQEAGE